MFIYLLFYFYYYFYLTGVSAPRGGYNTSLPSARDVSILVHRPVYREDRKFTVMLAVWGQFIDHDISATALSRGYWIYLFFFITAKYRKVIYK